MTARNRSRILGCSLLDAISCEASPSKRYLLLPIAILISIFFTLSSCERPAQIDPHSTSFEGIVIFDSLVVSANPSVQAAAQDVTGLTETASYSQGKLRIDYSGPDLEYSIVIGRLEHMKFHDDPRVVVLDLGVERRTVHSVCRVPCVEQVLGYDLECVEVKIDDVIIEYYSSSAIPVDPSLASGKALGAWSEAQRLAPGMVLKSVYKSTHYTRTRVAKSLTRVSTPPERFRVPELPRISWPEFESEFPR